MTDTTTEPIAPEPWSVWGNPYNGYFVWHEPTRKWLPVISDMADAVDPDHPAAQNLHQISAMAITAELITAGPDPAISQLGQQLQTLLAVQPQCAACAAEARQGQRPGVNLVNVIVGGEGLCHEHVDVVAGRLVRRNSSGLIVAGG